MALGGRAYRRKPVKPPTLDDMIGVAEVATMLGTHTNVVKRSIPPAELPFMRLGKRGDRKYRRGDVLDYIVRHTVSR